MEPPPAHVCDLLVQKGEALAAQLNATISRCSSGSSITVVEGEGVHPSLAQHHLYGQWLRQQAQRCCQPWVESRPWSTLPDRLVQAWQRPVPGEGAASASA